MQEKRRRIWRHQHFVINYLIKQGTDTTGAHPDDESLARRFLSMGVGHANNETILFPP